MKIASVIAGLVAGVGILLTPGVALAASCEQIEIPVALAPGLPKDQRIAGRHCTPSPPSIMHQIDVMVPGGTYDSLYWDFPYNNYQYSYVNRTLAASRATFDFDRLGTGDSSKPASALVTFDADVYTMHQAIQFLKHTYGYTDVTTIGHSMGSMAAVAEAAKFSDINRVVATGFMHSPSFNLILTLGTGLSPAALDPQFANAGLDPGYLTTVPGQREKAFYASSADPAVVAYDEAHKDIVSGVAAAGAVNQILLPPLLNASRNVTVPVLTVAGDQDILCGPPIIGVDCSSDATLKNFEQRYYPHAASYDAHIVPNTGHNLTLHPSADASFGIINDWIESH